MSIPAMSPITGTKSENADRSPDSWWIDPKHDTSGSSVGPDTNIS